MKADRGWLALGGLLLLAGCGGGGGGVDSTGTPPATTTDPTVTTPTPVTSTPTAAPVTTPVTINYNDAEYARSNGASDPGALAAYNAGATGAGVKLAIVDSGLAQIGTEFAGRVDAASRDFGGNASYADADGHGTAVAAVAAAARNGANIEGVAFDATILALRTDTAGTCGTTDGCKFNTATLATAIDYARTNGAKVINMSLGGAPATTALTAAINRATAAGIIVVIAGGNDATAQPDELAQVASTAAARGLVIIAGAHDANGALSTFSDQAGSYAQYYLTALGTRVRSFDNSGTAYLYSGTSFSAPAISGAIALLEQAFPNLTPAQIVGLLYSSATDAGAAGVDAVFGQGILNIARAFRPAGTTSLAGSAIAVGTGDTTILSSAMGDADLTGSSVGRAVVLDSLGRAYTMDLSARLARAAVTRPLLQSIGGAFRTTAARAGGLAISSTFAIGQGDEPWAGLAQRGVGLRSADVAARPIDGSAVARIGRRTQIGFAFAQGGRALARQLDPAASVGAYLAARAPGETPGFATQDASSFALRHDLGRLALIASAEQGRVARATAREAVAPAYTSAMLAAERRFGRLRLSLGAGALDERSTVLGARLAPAFGQAGAATRFLDVDARLALGGGWQAGAAWRRGWTRAMAGGALAGGDIATSATAIDLGRQGRTTRFGLRFAMPARVTSGGLALAVPVSYDYASGTIGYADERIGLTPHGRERDLEADYGVRLGMAWLESNLFYRRQPGSIAAAPDDLGAALRLSLGF